MAELPDQVLAIEADGLPPVALPAVAVLRGLPRPSVVSRHEPGAPCVVDPPLRVTVAFDTAQIQRGADPPFLLAGQSARVLSELVALGVPAGWEVVAHELWPDEEDDHALRKKWDVVLGRQRTRRREQRSRREQRVRGDQRALRQRRARRDPPRRGGVPVPSSASERLRYTRHGLLGKGGTGIVYLAQDHRLGRAVATPATPSRTRGPTPAAALRLSSVPSSSPDACPAVAPVHLRPAPDPPQRGARP